MEIIEEAARIGGFHDDLTVSRVAFEAGAGVTCAAGRHRNFR